METVQTRLAANARAIAPEGTAFTSALPGHAAFARFDSAGLELGEVGAAEPVRLRFSAWGAAGAERAVEAVEPALGDCLTDVLPDGSCVRQLEYAHDGVTAWWVGLDRGVEFGWTVAAAPAGGDGALTFSMQVEGADWLEQVGEGAELVDAAGETWTVSGALAWGADGAPLPAWLEVEGDALVVVVDAAEAVYPVTVDPVLSAAATTLPGSWSQDFAGQSVSSAGDVNGDGFDDVIVGAPEAYVGASRSVGFGGRAWVYHGSAAGVSTTASLSLAGTTYEENLGWSVSGAGDVNGDGYDDIIIGARRCDAPLLTNAGCVFIHHGSASGLSATPSQTLRGDEADAQFGYAVSDAGDVNGDGYDDVVIGAADKGATNTGAVYIHHGSASGVSATADRTLLPETFCPTATCGHWYQYGASVAAAGDVNGDGFDDIIVGAPFVRPPVLGTAAGAAFIHHGSASSVSATPNRTTYATTAGEFYGTSVSGAGDVNGDGYDDVIIGGYDFDSGGLFNRGGAFIHHGSAGGVSASPDTTLMGQENNNQFGRSVSGAGDVDNDGYADVIVNAPYHRNGTTSIPGAAYIFEGSSAGVSASTFTKLLGGSPMGDYWAWSVSGAGDVNGDGFSDVIIGDWYYTTATFHAMGAGHVFHGYCVTDCREDADGDGIYVGGDGPQDCDDADDAVGGPSARYVDADLDGFGSTTTVEVCPGVPGTAAAGTDCDDTDAAVGGPTSWYLDYDRDGAGSASYVVPSCLDLSSTGVFTLGAAAFDCDDFDPTVTEPTVFFADTDGDTFGDAASTTESCDESVAGHVTNSDDCDDTDPLVMGPTEWFPDNDDDGYGTDGETTDSCTEPEGFAAVDTDCDDNDASAFPGGTETCGDGADSDCDGVGDEDSDDEDGDGVSNADEEGIWGSNPCDPDEDGDGILLEGATDADYDGTPDFLDNTADPYAVINENAAATSRTAVTLNFSPPAGTDQICSANSATGTCTFVSFGTARTRSHTLATTQGVRTVYVKFRAAASPTAVTTLTDTILLDTVKPVNGTASATATAGQISLSWTGFSDAASGLATTSTYSVVRATGATAPTSCTTGTAVYTGTGTSTTVTGLVDGTQYSFRVCARDAAGNLSTGATATETPGADQTGPTGTIEVAGGAAYTRSSSAAYTVSAVDDLSAVTHMCVSTSTTCTTFSAYATSGTVSLGSTTGTKTVYATFRDANGNVGSAALDTVVLDVTRPTDGAAAVTATAAGSGEVSLAWGAATDAHAGVASYTVAYRTGTTAPTACTAATGVTVVSGLSGTSTAVTGLLPSTRYSFRVCALDGVGNTSTGKTASVITASSVSGPPVGGDEPAAGPVSDGADAADTHESAAAGCQSAPLRFAGIGVLGGLLGVLRRRRQA